MNTVTLQSPRSRAIADLTHLVTVWPELRDALTARAATWPPVMGLQYLRDDEQQEADAAEHADRTDAAPGEHPAPLAVGVLDTITGIRDDLVHLADEIADSIQRPALTVRSASPADLIARDAALLAARDAADPRRWRYNLASTRTGHHAAAWLGARLVRADGPFRPLSDGQVRRIAAVAAACRHRAEPITASPTDQNGHEVPLDQPCGCGGRLTLTNDVHDFRIRCASCGTTWNGAALLADLAA